MKNLIRKMAAVVLALLTVMTCVPVLGTQTAYAALPDYNFKMKVAPGNGMKIDDFTETMLRNTGGTAVSWLKPDYSVDADIAWSQVYWMSENKVDGTKLKHLPSDGVYPLFEAGKTYYFHVGLYGFDKDTYNTFKAALANKTSKPTITTEDGGVYNMTKYKADDSKLYIYMVFGPFKVTGVEYSVNFYAKDQLVDTQTVSYGEKAVPADTPSSDLGKYTGGTGWYTKNSWDNDNSERYAYDFDKSVEGDLNLYWRWETPVRFRSLKNDGQDACRALFEGRKVGQQAEKYDTLNNTNYAFTTAADKPLIATAYPTRGNKFVGWYFGPPVGYSGDEAYQLDYDKAVKVTDDPRLWEYDATKYYWSGKTDDEHYQYYLWAVTEPLASSVEIEDVDFGTILDEPYDEESWDDDTVTRTVKITNNGDFPVSIDPLDSTATEPINWRVLNGEGEEDSHFDFPGDPSAFFIEPGQSATYDLVLTRYLWSYEAGDNVHIAPGYFNRTLQFTGADSRGEEVVAYAQVTAKVEHQPLKWHDWENPTCETEGHEIYYQCPGCGKYFLDAQAEKEVAWEDLVRPATGHDFSGTPEQILGDDVNHNVSCLNDSSHIKAEPHHFDAGVITTEPTLSTEGVKTYTCNDCGYEKTETIAKLQSVDTIDIGNVWVYMDPLHVIPFTGEINPDSVDGNGVALTDKMALINEIWTNKEDSTDFIDKENPGKLQAGKTYEYKAVVQMEDSWYFNKDDLPTFIYGGSEVPWSGLQYDISPDNRTLTVWGFVPDVTVQGYSLKAHSGDVTVSAIVDKTYTGNGITPEPTVKLSVDGETLTLVKGTDYELSYKDNTNAGTASVIIKGKGNYTGSIEKTFRITAKKITPGVTLSANTYTWNGKVRKPAVIVKDGSTKLAVSDYTVTYRNNKNVGKASAVVTMKGNYSGTGTVTFRIDPKGTSLSNVIKGKKAVTVKWKKQAAKMSSSRITGYQIQLATNSKFTKNKKTVNVKGYSKVSKKVTGLKGGKKYWVKIRTYKTVNGTKYWSSWSKAKTVTTKK